MAGERTAQHPLTEDDLVQLKQALALNTEIEAGLNKAKLAGVNVEEKFAQNREQRKQIQAMLNTYFPGR